MYQSLRSPDNRIQGKTNLLRNQKGKHRHKNGKTWNYNRVGFESIRMTMVLQIFLRLSFRFVCQVYPLISTPPTGDEVLSKITIVYEELKCSLDIQFPCQNQQNTDMELPSKYYSLHSPDKDGYNMIIYFHTE